ncbi:hypothetical protein WJX81_007172 [Elliptochloris bilobata]|uniref:Serine aminopeptidase S33 domain-containing protein n=1 Tax=Elliptochloris bilobata TaxID=381761 RepID=A0AAW1SBY7_9CHLO
MVATFQKQSRAGVALGATCAALGAAAAYAWYYQRHECRRPDLYFKDGSEMMVRVLRACPLLQEPYRPTFWATNPHVQTMMSVLRKLSIRANFRRHLLPAPDGGTVGLDFFDGCDEYDWPADTPVLLLIHGLAGSSEDGYAKWMAATATSKGWRAAILNYRGAGGVPLTSCHVSSAAFTGDIHLALQFLSGLFPGAPLLACGYSMGGLMLTKYLAEADSGEWGGGARLAAAAVVSSPFCPAASNARLSQAWSAPWCYNVGLTRLFLRQFCFAHRATLAAGRSVPLDLDSLASANTMDAFIERVICKVYHHATPTLDEYFSAARAHRHIPAIRTPTLFLGAADDPFLGNLPLEEAAANPYTLLALTSRGGHVGFLSGAVPLGRVWMDDVVAQFLAAAASAAPPRPPAAKPSPAAVQAKAAGAAAATGLRPGRRCASEACLVSMQMCAPSAKSSLPAGKGGALAIVAEALAAETAVPPPPPSTPPRFAAAAALNPENPVTELWLRAPAGLAAAANSVASARSQRNWGSAGGGPAGRMCRNQSF